MPSIDAKSHATLVASKIPSICHQRKEGIEENISASAQTQQRPMAEPPSEGLSWYKKRE
jgi:hypothetical protein